MAPRCKENEIDQMRNDATNDDAAPEEDAGILDSVYKWGASWINYASEQLNTSGGPF